MNRKYIIKRINPERGEADDALGKLFHLPAGLEEARIDIFPWDQGGYKPECKVRIGWDEGGLHVFMFCLETEPKKEVQAFCGPVCHDSCMELFMNPNPAQSKLYFNYECNAHPNVFLSIGTCRGDRMKPKQLPKGMGPSVKEMGIGWGIQYMVTAEFLEQYFNMTLKSGAKMKANFYKCGDKTEHPHYGCWNQVEWEKPDFHRPEFFGDIVLA